jgi:hypothetical protein
MMVQVGGSGTSGQGTGNNTTTTTTATTTTSSGSYGPSGAVVMAAYALVDAASYDTMTTSPTQTTTTEGDSDSSSKGARRELTEGPTGSSRRWGRASWSHRNLFVRPIGWISFSRRRSRPTAMPLGRARDILWHCPSAGNPSSWQGLPVSLPGGHHAHLLFDTEDARGGYRH